MQGTISNLDEAKTRKLCSGSRILSSFWLENLARPLGSSISVFLCPLLFFSANGGKALPGQNPAECAHLAMF